MTKMKTNEALSPDEIMKAAADRKAKEEEAKRAEAEAKKNAPKIASIWIKKLNINKSNPMNDTADIQLTWSDGRVEDIAFNIGTSGETLDTIKWNDPNDAGKDAEEIEYQREVGDGGYNVKDGYLQMDKFYRDIVRSLKETVKIGRKFDHTEYPERHDIGGSLMPTRKGSRHDTQLYKGKPVYTGGKLVKNPFQAAGVRITDEDVRVCMIKFGFASQPDIKWYYGKNKYEDPIWAFSRVKPDESVKKIAKEKVQKAYKGKEVFKSGRTTIYKLM